MVGDDAAGTAPTTTRNDLRIARDFAAALERDNHLIGLGGDDRLTGGAAATGSPAAPAPTGSAAHGSDDRLAGAGGDRLSGGTATTAVRRRRRDVLVGGRAATS